MLEYRKSKAYTFFYLKFKKLFILTFYKDDDKNSSEFFLGCEQVCYNYFAPISQIRFWSFQILLTCTPTLVSYIFKFFSNIKFYEIVQVILVLPYLKL